MKHRFRIALISNVILAIGPLLNPARGECPAEKDWVDHPQFSIEEPPEGKECAFYQSAWRAFLWCMQQEQNGQPRFLSFTTPDELFVPSDSATPLNFVRKSNFAATMRTLATAKTGAIKRLGLAPRLAKQQRTVINNGIVQAGELGALVDQHGRVVYFAQHVNNEFGNYVKSKGFQNASNLATATPDDVFPAGAMELKSSWRVKQPGEAEDHYIAVDADVPTLLTNAHGELEIHPEMPRPERVLLVGIHVVFVTKGHSEFIWATFEHEDNAPDLPADAAADRSKPVDNSRNWTFYKKGTPARDCNKANRGVQGDELLHLVDAQAQTLAPITQVFREFSHGGEDKPGEELNPLNDSIHGFLPQASPLKSYFLLGAIWMNKPNDPPKLGQKSLGMLPPRNFGFIRADNCDEDQFGGERKMSNSTIETFTQSDQHCFSCHDTHPERIKLGFKDFPGTPIGVSHILRSAYAKDPKPDK